MEKGELLSYQLFPSFLSGAVGLAVGYPLDTVKVDPLITLNVTNVMTCLQLSISDTRVEFPGAPADPVCL